MQRATSFDSTSTSPEFITVDFVNSCFGALDDRQAGLSKLCDVLLRFINENEDPANSSNFLDVNFDDTSILGTALNSPDILCERLLVLRIVKVLQILMRKRINRERVHHNTVRSVCSIFDICGFDSPEIVAESANFILNICYHRANVPLALASVSSLAKFLQSSKDDKITVAVAGALQSMCWESSGKTAVLQAEAVVPCMLSLLVSSYNIRVIQRCLGALHNLTSDKTAVDHFLANNGIATIIKFLGSEYQPDVKRHAAAILQNLSRSKVCLPLIRELGAVDLLSQCLLTSNDLECQVSVVGALLNIQGKSTDNTSDRLAFRKVLSDSLVVGMMKGILEETMEAHSIQPIAMNDFLKENESPSSENISSNFDEAELALK